MMNTERAAIVKEFCKANTMPVQELCPEVNQYINTKNGYEMWNSRTLERKSIDWNPTYFKYNKERNKTNVVSVRQEYDGLYIRYIAELDALEMAHVIMEGNRGQNGVQKRWGYRFGERFFLFRGDPNVYLWNGNINLPDRGGRWAKDTYDMIRQWSYRSLVDKVNYDEFHKYFPEVNLYPNNYYIGYILWVPPVYMYADWYKVGFCPRNTSSLTLKLTNYELEDVNFEKKDKNGDTAIYYQQLDADYAVLRFYCYPNSYDYNKQVRQIYGNPTEKIRLFISSKGKPTIMCYEQGSWVIKASMPWSGCHASEVINKEEMETWKPLKYILPCLEGRITLQNITDYLRHPVVEQMYKAGYVWLAGQMNGGYIPSHLKDNYAVEKETKQPLFKMLGVNKFVLQAAEEYHAENLVKELKRLYGTNDISGISKEAAETIARYITTRYGYSYNKLNDLVPGRYSYYCSNNTVMNEEEREWIFKLLKIEEKREGCLSLYKDVISTYNSLNTKPDIDLFGVKNYEDIQRLHDALVALKVQQDAERRAYYDAQEKERMAMRQKKFEKLQKERIEKYEYEGKDFCIRVPHQLEEITKEGISLHHCVGGYLDRHAMGETNIIFLRRKESEDTPWFTIEVDNENHVVQIHGSHNRWLGNEPEVVPFMYQYLLHIGAKFDKKLLLNKGAGYSPSGDNLDESYLVA